MAKGTDPPVRSIARAIDILMVLTTGAMPLGSIAYSTDLTKGTVHRLLATLGYRQFVIQDPQSGLYMLGPGMLTLVDQATRGLGGLGLLARPVMEELQELTGETVALHVRIGDRRICIDEIQSNHPVRYTSGKGETVPVHTGSAGKVLLAYLPTGTLDEILNHSKLEALTDATIVDPKGLREVLETIKSQGWAESRGERIEGAVGISAPVFGGDGETVAALSVLGPSERLEPVLSSVCGPLVEGAKAISASLGSLGWSGEDRTA